MTVNTGTVNHSYTRNEILVLRNGCVDDGQRNVEVTKQDRYNDGKGYTRSRDGKIDTTAVEYER
jgi:hypothetical protein